MDTMIMSVRVAMLVLATSLFAAIWANDCPMEAAYAAPSIDLQYEVPRIGIQLEAPAEVTFTSTINHTTRISDVIPLPAEIISGTYLVVDQYGQTTTRVVHGTDLTAYRKDESAGSRTHYEVAQGQRRWHFVRIEQSSNPRSAMIPEEIH